jgi:hypothetical protein
MGELTITNANFAFKIKGHTIKVGDDISKLASVHPDAYEKSQKAGSRSKVDQVLLNLEYTDLTISFLFNPVTNSITLIQVHQSLV